MKTFIVLSLMVIMFLCPMSCNVGAADKPASATQQPLRTGGQIVVGMNQEIQNIKPKKPVRIKLHRNANGEYTWDITGDNPDDVCRADTRLKKLLKIEQ
jgi:hypothetical protein